MIQLTTLKWVQCSPAVDSKGDNAAIDGKFDANDFRTFSENLATAEENSADKFLKLAYKNLSSND